MSPCLAETYYFLSLLNTRNEQHASSVALAASLRRPLVTTSWVLIELADGLAKTPGRALFAAFLQRLRSEPRMTIVATSDDLFNRGVKLYESRPDKGWSLTDCISFVVMSDHGMTEALTADHHFEQAGFKLMMN